MSELWDFGSEETDALSDSDGEVQEVSDTDFLLPKSKRQKLQRQFKGRGGGGRASNKQKQEQRQRGSGDEGGDSDIDLLNSSPDVNAAAAAAGAAAVPARPGMPQAAGVAGRRGGPELDARSSDLLQQLKATQDAMRLAAAEVDLTQEDEEADLPEPSPVHLRQVGRWSGRRGQQQQAGGGDGDDEDDDDDFEILEETLPSGGGERAHAGDAVPAAAAADDKIPLKLQSAKGVKVLKMRRTDPFQKMFDVYKKFALEQGWIAALDAPVKFIFDGDQVAADETPVGLELDGDEMIEVRF